MFERIKAWIMGNVQYQPENGARFLIVGLGNPGREHSKNRHNIGFMTVDHLAKAHGISIGRTQGRALVGTGQIAGREVILAKPQAYMNRSGDVVGPLAKFYRIEPQHILVIYDELDLPLGALRLRPSGGSGGHNGMKSIIQHIGNDFPRLRLGIGRPPGRMEPADFVLKDFRGSEVETAQVLIADGAVAVETFLREGIDMAMTRHNSTGND